MSGRDTVADVIKELGLYGIKALVTLNAGAVIVTLTFLGNVQNSETVSFDIERLKYGIFAFLAGIGFAYIAVLLTYIYAQRSYYTDGESDGSFWPFILKMTLPTILAFVAFCVGVIVSVSGISSA